VEDFPSTGTTTKFKPFNINLKNCSRGITSSSRISTPTPLASIFSLPMPVSLNASSAGLSLSAVPVNRLSQSIDLGQFSVEDFPSTGTTTKFKPFNINLKNCRYRSMPAAPGCRCRQCR
jgi:type 1 fimbria pilin